MKNSLLLIDGNNKVFTSEWGKGLYWKGLRTSGILTFLMSLRGYAEKYGRKNIIVCWDSPVKDKKKRELYPDYKANRKRNSFYFEIKSEINRLQEILPMLGIKQAVVDGYEADDLIAVLKHYRSKKYDKVIIVSTDSDLYQLLDDRTSILKSKEKITVQTLRDKGFGKVADAPQEYLLMKVVVGDTSDNIKGVNGIGIKTFFKVLNSSRSLDDAIRQFGQPEIIERNYNLMRLRNNKSLRILLKQNLKKGKPNTIEFHKRLYGLGMFSIMKNFRKWVVPFK